MARISGVDLPKQKRVEVGLTYIYGIGLSTARNILKETGVNGDIRVKDLSSVPDCLKSNHPKQETAPNRIADY